MWYKSWRAQLNKFMNLYLIREIGFVAFMPRICWLYAEYLLKIWWKCADDHANQIPISTQISFLVWVSDQAGHPNRVTFFITLEKVIGISSSDGHWGLLRVVSVSTTCDDLAEIADFDVFSGCIFTDCMVKGFDFLLLSLLFIVLITVTVKHFTGNVCSFDIYEWCRYPCKVTLVLYLVTLQ